MNFFPPTTINLASEPFRRERAQNASLALICAGLTCSLLVLVVLILHSRAQAADLRRGIEADRAELQQLSNQETRYSNFVSKPANADVFATSVLLNELIARRGVSWTRVFRDLATIMPADVRLVGVRLPRVAEEEGTGIDRVQLDMIVGTNRPEAVIDLLRRLQQSSLFGPAQVMTQTPPSQNDPLYKYRVSVNYAQKI
jgi:type IV pilus assembly protein PilN